MRICLDAGHYGKYNRSPVDGRYYESDMVWKLHLLQKKYLEEYGVEVILTRGSQGADRDLYGRGIRSAWLWQSAWERSWVPDRRPGSSIGPGAMGITME